MLVLPIFDSIMKNVFIILVVVLVSFAGGYFTKSWMATTSSKKVEMGKEKQEEKTTDEKLEKNETPRVTGIGGVFFKSQNPAKLKKWYSENLGMPMDDYGTNFEWRQGEDASKKGFTLWAPFNSKTNYFLPSARDFMINYRVENLKDLLVSLKKKGIVPVDSVEVTEYGSFVHLMDPERNKIELWEPIDEVYDTIIDARTK